MEDMLRGIAVMMSVLVSQKNGDVGEVVEAIGGTLNAQNMDGDRICPYVGRRRLVEGNEMLETISWGGILDEIKTGGDLASELAYENYRSSGKIKGDVYQSDSERRTWQGNRVFSNSSEGYRWATDISDWRVGKKERLRVIQDLWAGRTNRKREG